MVHLVQGPNMHMTIVVEIAWFFSFFFTTF
jgi:hypothetical protein